MLPFRDHNPSRRTPYVTYLLMALNIGIYLCGLAFVTTNQQIGQLYFDYGMIPARISNGDNFPSLVTSLFLHAGFLHLAGNMLFLWIFGDNIEDEMGPLPFLTFYLAAGVCANLAQLAASPETQIATIGASGAIAGVMGGYLLMFPKARVDIFAFLMVFAVPAWIMLALWFGLQLFGGLGSDPDGSGVAYWAHAGGFVAGIILALPLWLRRGAAGYWVKTNGHPPHPDTVYRSRVPHVRRR